MQNVAPSLFGREKINQIDVVKILIFRLEFYNNVTSETKIV